MHQTTIYDFILSDEFDTKKPLSKLTDGVTQECWIKENLEKRGFLTRNEALTNYISRLAARIRDLKEKGMDIKSKKFKTQYGIDHVYYL